MQTYLENFSSDLFSISSAKLGLWGKWQIDNASVAIALVSQVIKLKEDNTRRALEETMWEGRMEILREKSLLIIDGAHNPDGVKRVVHQLIKHGIKLTPVFTGLKDKEWRESMTFLRKLSEKIYLVPINHHRGEELSELIQHAQRLNFREVVPLSSARDVFGLKEDVLVLGSLYLLGEVKKCLEEKRV
jgi:dihydrofolate synthase/folylpolyglutamate synthase